MIPYRCRLWWISVIMLVIAQGCSGNKITTRSAPQIEQYHIKKVAIVPFETLSTPQPADLNGPSLSVPAGVKRSDISVAVPSATDVHPRFAQPVPPSAGETVTDLVWGKLKNKPGLEIIPPGQVRKSLGDMNRAKQVGSLESLGQQVAARLGADAALIGTVLVYQERVGSRLGASPPATVGFEMKLIGNDGAVIWEGDYYERQRPMSEDLWGFIQRYGAFVTADELAAYGSEQLAREFPFGGPVQK